jgi:pimeloyl-ACP methyl ester carboxylesterase
MPSSDPIVIFGGFLSFPRLYNPMRAELARLTGLPVSLVPAYSHDWLATVSLAGCKLLLDKLDRAVRRAARHSASGKVTLIAHSQGGVLARLYLAPGMVFDRCYDGQQRASRLVTLGSPHYSQGGVTRGEHLTRYVQSHCPDACFDPPVRCTSVAGKLIRGSLLTTSHARWAYRRYAELCGDGAVWGDGIIPLPSALLAGSQQIILEDVAHFTGLSSLWYGSPQVIPQWWFPAVDDNLQPD